MRADDILFAPIHGSSDLRLPECWLDITKSIRAHRPEWRDATIAGGALRDLDLGRAIKDVDIFLPYVDSSEDHLLDALDGFEYTEWNVIDHQSDKASAVTKGIPHQHYQFRVNGWLFEVTQKSEDFNHRTILDSFDLGICMISLDGEDIYRTTYYKDDVKNQNITIVNKTGGKELSHAQRLLHKYPNWNIVRK